MKITDIKLTPISYPMPFTLRWGQLSRDDVGGIVVEVFTDPSPCDQNIPFDIRLITAVIRIDRAKRIRYDPMRGSAVDNNIPVILLCGRYAGGNYDYIRLVCINSLR